MNRIWTYFKCFPSPSQSSIHQEKRNQREFWWTYYIFGLNLLLFYVCIHERKDNYNTVECVVMKALSQVILYCSFIITYSNLLFQLRSSNIAPSLPQGLTWFGLPTAIKVLEFSAKTVLNCAMIFIPCPWVGLNWEVITHLIISDWTSLWVKSNSSNPPR